MTISINQPAFIPWPGYFHRMLISDLHVVLDHVQFEKNSVTNRNKIKAKNGKEMWLTIPLQTSGKFGDLPINEVKIFNDHKWQRRIVETIRQTYSKASFFHDYFNDLESIFSAEYILLNEIIKPTTRYLMDKLEIKTPTYYSSEIELKSGKSDLILELCKHFNADTYISGPLGRNYLEMEKFAEAEIEIIFHNYNYPTYTQINGDFITHLSVLDLLFNKGPESRFIFQTTN